MSSVEVYFWCDHLVMLLCWSELSVRIASQYRFFPVSAIAQRDYRCSNADFNMAGRAIEYPERMSDTSCSKIYQKLHLYVELFLLVQACTTVYAVPLGYR